MREGSHGGSCSEHAVVRLGAGPVKPRGPAPRLPTRMPLDQARRVKIASDPWVSGPWIKLAERLSTLVPSRFQLHIFQRTGEDEQRDQAQARHRHPRS